MKSTGIVRKVDELGRIVIPKSFRDKEGIKTGTPLEMYSNDNGMLAFKKFQKCCILCGEIGDIEVGDNKYLCEKHHKEIKGI